jgi:hypothetical protein
MGVVEIVRQALINTLMMTAGIGDKPKQKIDPPVSAPTCPTFSCYAATQGMDYYSFCKLEWCAHHTKYVWCR